MAFIELEASVVLAVSAACSLIVFFISRPKEGGIELPPDVEQDTFSKDPFSMLRPEDIVDGTPVDGESFWAKMLWRKVVMSILLMGVLCCQCIILGWSAIQDEDDHATLVLDVIHVAFALYTLLVAVRSVKQRDDQHAASIIHLFSLTFIGTILIVTAALVPSSAFGILRIARPSSTHPTLWYTIIILYVPSFVIALTTPCGPPLHLPPRQIYPKHIVNKAHTANRDNVCGITGASMLEMFLFSYTTKVVKLGYGSGGFEIADLPIVPATLRAAKTFADMRDATRQLRLHIGSWSPKPGSGLELTYQLLRVNAKAYIGVVILSSLSAATSYVPAFFLQRVVRYLEFDPDRTDRSWAWVYCAGLFFSKALVQLLTGQMWSIAVTTLQVRLRLQLNTTLFAKTLVRKDVASVSSASASGTAEGSNTPAGQGKKKTADNFSSKSQIMTLMTTDVDRISESSRQLFYIIDAPVELIIGTLFLYRLLGVSSFLGLAVSCLFLPLNHFGSNVVVGAQSNLMKARDQRLGLINEILGGIRMLKFMAWERSFEDRVMKIRARELKYQRLNYHIQILFSMVWSASPILVTLVSFWHFAVVREQALTPSIAFTSISVFGEMKDALNVLPETIIEILQSLVSLRRIEKYLKGAEIQPVNSLSSGLKPITMENATVTWPSSHENVKASDTTSITQQFKLIDITAEFPHGELSLICGKLGSGKSLLLLALLGEADVLAGKITCPHSPPDAIASFADTVALEDEWIVQGISAYVPQTAWLRNASIRDNILFNLPYVEGRYQETLRACALLEDLKILEDGDMSEIGERGVNLSGGQKARVALARAVYSRASIILMDDVLSAVDAHTAHHLFYECLKGDLMRGRTIILVSHHVQLCSPGAKYVVVLDNGRVMFQGAQDQFRNSKPLDTVVVMDNTTISPMVNNEDDAKSIESLMPQVNTANGTSSAPPSVDAKPLTPPEQTSSPRKLVEEEKRASGRIAKDIWITYCVACGGYIFWTVFGLALFLAALSPVAENGWLRIWSGSALEPKQERSPSFYISIYATICATGVVLSSLRWVVMYQGGIHASTVLYQKLLESILFASIRFHDTVSRGLLLNRFGKDFEGIDSRLPDSFGRSLANLLSVAVTFITIIYVGGLPSLLATLICVTLYYNVGKMYGQTSRDLKRLDSITRSPLYSIYAETISGVTVLRAFGASTHFMREMLSFADTNSSPFYWSWGLNRWLTIRFNLLSSAILGMTAFLAILTPGISASLAGFALSFAASIMLNLLQLVRRFVTLEQSMIAIERIKELLKVPQEALQYVEPRPPASWPENGAIECQDLVIRYAPDLPDVLHNLTFSIHPGEKVGVLGRTGSGKSTLALSFFRFVEPASGRIIIDDVDISKIGLADLRSRLTIIPQDPTIMSGTLRSTLDVFNEYDDTEIIKALRSVHLIPENDEPLGNTAAVNANAFRNLDTPVSESGDNFSTGEKQLLCMARAILKQSKILLMDEATASVDYATDELIGKTIRQEFAGSTIITIAHRLRTVIDYDRVILLEEGRIVEHDRPGTLLADPSSRFHSLCKATGTEEFAALKRLARQ